MPSAAQQTFTSPSEPCSHFEPTSQHHRVNRRIVRKQTGITSILFHPNSSPVPLHIHRQGSCGPKYRGWTTTEPGVRVSERSCVRSTHQAVSSLFSLVVERSLRTFLSRSFSFFFLPPCMRLNITLLLGLPSRTLGAARLLLCDS